MAYRWATVPRTSGFRTPELDRGLTGAYQRNLEYMATLFGFISNRPDSGRRAFERYRKQLSVANEAEEQLAWGVGFYQAGEVLLRRRPSDTRAAIDLTQVLHEVHGEVLIGHVRKPTVGNLRTENTHPFRYRQWLFAQTGTIKGFDTLREELMESQPQFLRSNIRGDTDSEVFLYSFLSFLNDAGSLNSHFVSPEPILDALRATVKLVDRLSTQAGHAIGRGDALITNGEFLIALHRSGNLAQRVYADPKELEDLLQGSDGQARTPRNLEGAHLTLLANGLEEPPTDWERVEPGSILVATRTEAPQLFPL